MAAALLLSVPAIGAVRREKTGRLLAAKEPAQVKTLSVWGLTRSLVSEQEFRAQLQLSRIPR